MQGKGSEKDKSGGDQRKVRRTFPASMVARTTACRGSTNIYNNSRCFTKGQHRNKRGRGENRGRVRRGAAHRVEAKVPQAAAKVTGAGLRHAVRHPLVRALADTPTEVLVVREALDGAAEEDKMRRAEEKGPFEGECS